MIPEWATVDAKVAEVGGHIRNNYAPTTIKSVGKKYIVLRNGSRYDHTKGGAELRRWTGGTWGSSYVLLADDDPEVVGLRWAARRSAVAQRVEPRLRAWTRTGDPTTLQSIVNLLHGAMPS